ncbi:MAG TPA: DoxX family membrane protein [Acidobacteriaceae bacterium]|nr:DoxX family membrane protein [Acidobacteriaceae bacterium]
MSISLPHPVILAARVLFVSYFFLMGGSHLLNFREHSLLLRRKGVPLPKAATLLTVVMMVGGSVLFLFDRKSWAGCILLFGIIFPAPFFLHKFWRESEPYMRLSEFAHMLKDLSLAGAAILLLR